MRMPRAYRDAEMLSVFWFDLMLCFERRLNEGCWIVSVSLRNVRDT